MLSSSKLNHYLAQDSAAGQAVRNVSNDYHVRLGRDPGGHNAAAHNNRCRYAERPPESGQTEPCSRRLRRYSAYRLASSSGSLARYAVSTCHRCSKPSENALRNCPPVLFPEASGVLSSLRAAGYSLVLSSNTPEERIQVRLGAAGIVHHFDLTLEQIWRQALRRTTIRVWQRTYSPSQPQPSRLRRCLLATRRAT